MITTIIIILISSIISRIALGQLGYLSESERAEGGYQHPAITFVQDPCNFITYGVFGPLMLVELGLRRIVSRK